MGQRNQIDAQVLTVPLWVGMGWSYRVCSADHNPQLLGSNVLFHLHCKVEKNMERGPVLQYRNDGGNTGRAALRNYIRRRRTKWFKPQPTQMPRVSPQKPLGFEIRPRRLLFRRGNCQGRLVLETAQGLQPDCWQPFDHRSEPLSMGWPWGRGLLWGGCLMICQQRTRQTDCWQLPGCNRRVDFYSHPWCSLLGRG